MIQKPMDVLNCYPIRKSSAQKLRFREDVTEYARSMGYAVSVEKKGMSNNVVIGDPKTAKYLITAHYDTPAVMPIPNLITPCNFFLYLLYQFFACIIILLPFEIVYIPLRIVSNNSGLAFCLAYIVLFAMLFLVYFGPANRNNANDNTSGVVTVLETAKNMPQELRSRVCFVLFDHEELMMVGSGKYRRMHRKETNNQIVLNLDCVGDGDEILMFPTGKVKRSKAILDWLNSAAGKFETKSVAVRKKGFSAYPSDQSVFPYGVGIAAFRRCKLGLYLSRIHTPRDTVLEEENVNFLRSLLIGLVGKDATE